MKRRQHPSPDDVVLRKHLKNTFSEVAFSGAYSDLTGTATGITPGSYTSVNITVGADGRITAIANGSGGSGTLTQGKALQLINTEAWV